MARTSADITIHRIDGTTLTVPITPEARRTWRLMREDNIRLRWDSATEYRAMVGDWVDDELFGPFYVTEAQDPTIDQSTGAYRHDVRFDREYIGWRNVLHMLVYDDNGSDARKETEWHLTDTLANQLSVVTRNLAVLGYSYTYSVDDVDEASRAIAMSFSGTSIYDALNAMADAWKCEWWVTYNSDYTAGVIHMGRMETSESRYTITLGDNAETVNASKSEAEYANRIFAYGSTRNIPDTYRKTLVFTVTDTQTLAGGTVFRDSARVIRKDMLKIGDTDSETRTVSLGTPAYEEDGGGRQYKAVMSDTVVLSRDTSFGIAGTLSYDMVFTRFEISEELDRTWAWRLKVDDTVLGSGSGIFATHETVDGRATKSLREEVSASATLAAGTHAVTLEIWTNYDEFALSSVTPNSWKLTLTPSGWSVDCPLVYNGNTYTVRFNPQSDASASGFNWFSFPDGVPSGFGVGKTYTLPFSDGDSAGLLMLKVPVSYYTDNMGDSMRMVGQKRLMLPSPGYVQSSEAGVRRVVEKVVIFEEEYPKLDLTVADIQTGTYTDNTEWSDGSRSYGTLPKYTVKLKQSGADFPFRKDYLTTDPLSLVFTSGKLSGMTFGVNFNQADMTYTIAFNEDYGAKLPNGTLKPENGDSVVLTGWNTGAIQSLGLVSAAEQRLLADAEAYLSAVNEPSLSLSCAMMSDRMVSGGLLSEGRKVRVVRGNLTVDTRVIGYEYKLDIPEDTPVYECGETDAYSRLRALEKALRASTQSVNSSGNTVSGSSVSPGGVSATLNGSLSWVSGNVESFQPDTFDGNGDKTLTIPTEIGHLAGNNQLPRIGGTIETLEDGAKVVDLLDSSGNRILPTGSLDWFISETYEENGETRYRLKLNPKYQGMYADGWVSSGGISDTSGGGSSYLRELLDVDDNLNPTIGQALVWDGTKWTADTIDPGTTVTEETVAGWGFTKNIGTVTQVKVGDTAYNPSNGVVSLPAYPTTLPASDVSAWAKKSSLAASDVPYLAISKITGLQSALDAKAAASDLTVLQDHFTGDSAKSALRLAGSAAHTAWGQTYWSSGVPASISGDMTGVGRITMTAQQSASSSGNVLEVVNVGTASAPVYALHSTLPIYSDSWVSAGGIGSSGDEGGASWLRELRDVDDNLNPHSGDALVYDGSKWTADTIDLTGFVTTSALNTALAGYATTQALATANAAISAAETDIDTLQGNFTGGAANSATRLQNSRTIWGQPFDGTNNVDGILSLSYASTERATGIEVTTANSGEASIGFASTNRTVFGRYADRGFVWGSVSGELMTFLDNGNVGVGMNAPAYKLDVNGDIRSGGRVYVGSAGGYLEVVNVAGEGETPVYALKSSLPFYSDSWVSAGGVSTAGSGGGGSSYLRDLLDVDVTTVSPVEGNALMWDSLTQKWVPRDVTDYLSGYVTTQELNTALAGYATTASLADYATTQALADYLPLAGGTMSGPISMAVTTTSLIEDESFRFTSGDSVVGSLRASSNGYVGLYAMQQIRLRPGGSTSLGLVISTTDITYNGVSIKPKFFYGTGNVSGTTVAVTSSGFTSANLTSGTVLVVSMNASKDTTDQLTLNVNSTGSRYIESGGLQGYKSWNASENVILVYSGSHWEMTPTYRYIINHTGSGGGSTVAGVSTVVGRSGDVTKAQIATALAAATRGNNPDLTTGETTANRYYGVESRADGTLFVNVPWTSGGGSYTLPAATSGALGGIRIGYTLDSANKRYPVQLDSNNRAYVNVPWSSGSGGSTVSVTQGDVTNATYGTLVGRITVDGTATPLYAPKVSVNQALEAGVAIARIQIGSADAITLYAPDGGSGTSGVASVAGYTGTVTTTQIATALTNAGYKLTDTVPDLSGYVTTGGLNSILSGYVSNQALTNTLSSYATTASLGSYLPLSAGSGKALTDTLYARTIRPSTNSTSQSTGYDLGASTAFWKNTYTRRVYLYDGIYVYYDTTNNCIRTNAPIVSDSYISAGGVSTT